LMNSPEGASYISTGRSPVTQSNRFALVLKGRNNISDVTALHIFSVFSTLDSHVPTLPKLLQLPVLPRIPKRLAADGIVDAGVDLIADQEHDRDQLDPYHDGDHHADRSIHFVVCGEISDIEREPVRNHQGKEGCDEGADRKETPVVMDGWAEIIQGRDREKKNNEDNDEPDRKDQEHGEVANVKPFKLGKILQHELSDNQENDRQENHECQVQR
jgi:hypothetical protein